MREPTWSADELCVCVCVYLLACRAMFLFSHEIVFRECEQIMYTELLGEEPNSITLQNDRIQIKFIPSSLLF
jgi:hypothetical protein